MSEISPQNSTAREGRENYRNDFALNFALHNNYYDNVLAKINNSQLTSEHSHTAVDKVGVRRVQC